MSVIEFGVNSKAGGVTARRQVTPQEFRQLAARWGKIVARRAFGDDGPELDVDFDAMEQVAQAAAAGRTEGTLRMLLDRQSAALGGAAVLCRLRPAVCRLAAAPGVVAVEVDGGRLRTRGGGRADRSARARPVP